MAPSVLMLAPDTYFRVLGVESTLPDAGLRNQNVPASTDSTAVSTVRVVPPLFSLLR